MLAIVYFVIFKAAALLVGVVEALFKTGYFDLKIKMIFCRYPLADVEAISVQKNNYQNNGASCGAQKPNVSTTEVFIEC